MPVLVPSAPSSSTGTTERTLIPDKTHVAAFIDAIEIRENNARDGYYLNIKVETTEACEWPRRWVYGMVSLKRTARWRVDEFLRATGASDADLAGDVCFYDGSLEDPPTLDQDSVLIVDTVSLLGDEVEIEIIIDKFRNPTTGEERISNKIGKFLPTTEARIAAHSVTEDDIPF
jgi:hypothetical protein